MVKNIKRILVTVLLKFMVLNLNAQTHSIVFNTVSLPKGLSHNSVYYITQNRYMHQPEGVKINWVNAGIWDKKNFAMLSTILPAYWKSWWFLWLIVLLFIVLVFIFYKRRVDYLTKRQEELEEHIKEAEKRRIEIVLKNRNALIELAKKDISNFEEALPKILKTIAKTIDIERVGFWKYNKEENSLQCEMLFNKGMDAIDENAEGMKLPATYSKIFNKIESGKNDSAATDLLGHTNALNTCNNETVENYRQLHSITSMTDAPVWFKGKVIGTICLEHIDTNREFILEEEDFIVSVATMVSLAMETSTRRIAEKNLKISEHHYKLVVEYSNDAITVGQNGKVKYANPRTTEIMGYTFEELASRNFVELIHPGDREMAQANHEKRMKGEDAMNFYELRIIHKNGSTIITEVSGQSIEWHGEPATLNFFTDITKRKNAEEEIKNALEKERELSELRSHFISMTSHEFRTPLTSIMSSAEIISNYYDKLNEEQKEKNLNRIQDNVRHMTQLLNDILFIGKTEAKKMEIKRDKVNLLHLCKSTVEQFEISTLRKTKRKLKLEAKNLADDACLDPKLIRQILNNIIANAIKYSPENSEIVFEAECRNDKILFMIKDQGIGIPDEDQDKIFQPFYRGKNVGTVTGTGLGMTIIKEIVELHEGSMEIQSEINEGTTIVIKLPLIRV